MHDLFNLLLLDKIWGRCIHPVPPVLSTWQQGEPTSPVHRKAPGRLPLVPWFLSEMQCR